MRKLSEDSALIELELKFDLSQLYFEDYWLYPLIKQSFLAPGLYHLNPDKELIKKSMNVKFVLFKNMLSAFGWALRNPKLSPFDMIISEYASSRMKMIRDRYYSIWSDHIYDLFPQKRILTLEKPLDKSPRHFRKTSSQNIYYADLMVQRSLLQSKLDRRKLNLDFSFIERLFEFLNLEYNRHSVEDRLRKFLIYINLYQNLFNRLQPRLVMINNSYEYSVMAMIAVCKKMQIKTVELQHGIIYHTHYGYIYKQISDYLLFPDYFFSYGKHFTDLLQKESKLFRRDAIQTVGFPFIEKVKNSPIDLDKDILDYCRDFDIIYITSQWTIRHELKKFCHSLIKLLPDNFRIIYKTHPREKLTEDFYRDIVSNPNVYLISDPKVSSLELMKIAKFHTTVYSTSLFEALYFGLPNILIYNETYSGNIHSFVDNQTVCMAKTTQDYLNILKNLNRNYSNLQRTISDVAGRFFAPNALEKHDEKIRWILNE